MKATIDPKTIGPQTINKFRARAAEEGLLDIAYTRMASPFGPLLLAQTSRGLVRVGLPNQDSDELLTDLATRVSPRVLEAPAELDAARRELDLYFAGKLDHFDLPLDWRLSSGFRQRVLQGIAAIPYGETRTYTEMATRAGNPRAVRATGTACATNPVPIVVPCHRVLPASHKLGNYGGGPDRKRALLTLEGALWRV